MPELMELARKAVYGPKWSLADGPCWCDIKREESARKGTKIHSGHCKAMKALSSYAFSGYNSPVSDNATRPSWQELGLADENWNITAK